MKYAILALALSGCASTNYGGIVTGSRCYDAEIASRAGLTQAQTSACEAKGRAVYWSDAGNTAFGAVDCVKAGNAYEACVSKK